MAESVPDSETETDEERVVHYHSDSETETDEERPTHHSDSEHVKMKYIYNVGLTPAKKSLYDKIRGFYEAKNCDGWVSRKDIWPSIYTRQDKQPLKGAFTWLARKHFRVSSQGEIDSHVGSGIWVYQETPGAEVWVCVK